MKIKKISEIEPSLIRSRLRIGISYLRCALLFAYSTEVSMTAVSMTSELTLVDRSLLNKNDIGSFLGTKYHYANTTKHETCEN